MHTTLKLLFPAIVCGAMLSSARGQSFEWRTAAPASQGFSAQKLESLQQDLAAKKTRALLVVRNDRIVCEWFADGQTAATKQSTASLAKAIVGGLSFAVAANDGLIARDDPAWKYVPQWKDDPLKSKITVRHLGSHTSGIDDSHNREEQARGVDQGSYTGWSGEFWRWRNGKQRPPNDAFTISRDVAPMLFEPGKDFQYSNPGIAMLTWCVTAAIKGTEQADVRTLLRERIMRPIGASDDEWSCGYGQTEVVEGLPMVANWGGGSYTPRATARIGRLVLRKGDWDGKQLLSPQSVEAMTKDAGLPGHCGMGWWTNGDGRYPDLPRDAVWGAGAGHQLLLVIPSLQLIAVRNGSAFPDGEFSNAAVHHLFEPLVAAITARTERVRVDAIPRGEAPYPPSPVIAGIEWAPKESIRLAASGCDNWPLTWADDGHLYGAYGDANGWNAELEKKVSCGLAKVSGGPDDFRGETIRSATFEMPGDGPRGRKCSGILMVDGVLYVWMRNAGNSILGWSGDHGQTWTFADWKFTDGFGAPTFLNFGRNYDGARDEFVYVYSTDSDSAYVPSDRMVLARVPKDRLRDRAAYEFFVKLDDAGQPVWSKQIDERGAAFTHPGRCYRSGVTYNAPLQRYLWCQVHPESTDSRGPRFQGGFGVYDAPEPWGPWTTVYFTNAWDVGPGDTNSFPTKWMSNDGRTMHLVFSGDDHFSVRQCTVMLKN
jgi:CubicO group peptidase (beta-lactamase class C family)